MADKKIKVQVDIDVNAEPSIAQLKALKKELKNTAAGSEDFKRLYNQIDDLEDKIKSAKGASADWVDTLESAGGPIGMLGSAINKAKVATVSFGAALKATGIGLIVAAVGGLVAAFTQVEGATKKLEPLLIGFEKILGGIFEALTPLIDAFVELATSALPYITTGIKVFYSSLVALFTLVKEAGVGVGKILKGVFTLDMGSIKEGWEQLKGGWGKTVDAYVATSERFEAGTKKLTKTQKENLKEQNDDAKKAFDEKLKRLEAEDKLNEAKLRKLKEEALALATTEQQKLDVERKFAELSYNAKLKDLDDRMALYKKDSVEYKNLQAEKIGVEADYISELTGFKEKQKKIDDEAQKDALEKAKKKAEIERGIKATELQAEFEELNRKNKQADADFQQDLERIKLQRGLLAEQEINDLSNTELTEFQRTEIRKKYADQRIALTDLEIATEKAATQAKADINMAYLQLFEQFGNLLGQVAGKNKALAIAGVVISQAASIGQIIANTGIANAKAVAASPLTFGAPWVLINSISAGLSIASTIAGAVKSIQQINSAASQAGIGGGGGGAAATSATAMPAAPRVSGTAAPEIQTAAGQNPNTQLAQTLGRASAPLKAYVVSGDISSQQALDRRTSRAATFSGG
jgi:hypothetical protein